MNGHFDHCFDQIFPVTYETEAADRIVKLYLELHPDSALELNSLRLVLKNQSNLPGLIGKDIIINEQTFAKTRRKALAKRKELSNSLYLSKVLF